MQLLILLPLVAADIPVHCTHSKLVGTWTFHVGTYYNADGSVNPQCGFAMPDTYASHAHLTPPYSESKKDGKYFLTSKFKEEGTVRVQLGDWIVIVGENEGLESFLSNENVRGTYTSVYNEGMDLAFTDISSFDTVHSLFAFHKYKIPDDNNINMQDIEELQQYSHCGETLLGWWKVIDRHTGAVKMNKCWWGERVGGLDEIFYWKLNNQKTMRIPGSKYDTVQSEQKIGENAKTYDMTKVYLGNMSGYHFMYENGAISEQVEYSFANRVYYAVADPPLVHSKDRKEYHQETMLAYGTLCIAVVLLVLSACTRCCRGGCMGIFMFSLIVSLLSFGCLVWYSPDRSLWHPVRYCVTSIPPESAPLNPFASVKDPLLSLTFRKPKFERLFGNGGAAKVCKGPVRSASPVVEQSQVLSNIPDTKPTAPDLIGFGSFFNGNVDARTIQAELKAVFPSHSPTADELHTVFGVEAGDFVNAHGKEQFFLNVGEGGEQDSLLPLDADGWTTLENFDWRRVRLGRNGEEGFVQQQVTDQGTGHNGCGDCYAMATTGMFTMRLMIRYPELQREFKEKNLRVSEQTILRCDSYNQGCTGGYPFLVSRYASEHDMVTSRCAELGGIHSNPVAGTCSISDREECAYRFRVSNFRYIGGAFGRCGVFYQCANAMKEEIYKGGPITGSVVPTGAFTEFAGDGHIMYEGDAETAWKLVPNIHTDPDCKRVTCYPWYRVDHSTLIVGWGSDAASPVCVARVPVDVNPKAPLSQKQEQENHKFCFSLKTQKQCNALQARCSWEAFSYWTLRNSWGSTWGNKGFGKIGPIGTNPLEIEVGATSADMVAFKNGIPAKGHKKEGHTKHVWKTGERKHHPLQAHDDKFFSSPPRG